MKIQLGSIIKNRYQLVCCLGRGDTAIIYKAEDLQRRSPVAIKIISLRDAQDWKTLELFEREAKILSSLDHPQIPKYLDYFEIDTEKDRYFCLVRESIEGLSLAEFVNSHYQITEQSVCAIAQKILEILKYLHGFTPPIIHRDIKPDNILRTSTGSVYLIDFGAVSLTQNHFSHDLDTFVGTLGYMPPEQFMGKVGVASDLYSLGCVVLFLLTKKCPADFPTNKLKINFKSTIKISRDFSDWLEKILEPGIEDRFSSAEEALQALSRVKFFYESTEPWKVILDEIKFETAQKSQVKQQPTVVDFSKINNSPLLRRENNTLWIYCPDSSYFRPQRLQIEKDLFILYVGNSLLQHPIQGNKEDLSVSLIKKEYGVAKQQNICCTLYDGSSFHQFGSELNYEQQLRLVKGINEFITDF